MKCTIEECPGEYEPRKTVHTVRYRGRLVVIDYVPAEVCSVCGDVLLAPDTIRRVGEPLRSQKRPSGTVPLFEYAS